MKAPKNASDQKGNCFEAPNISTVLFTNRMMEGGEKHLRERGFSRITVPRIVPATGACENVDTLFEIAVDGNMRWFRVNSEENEALARIIY